MMHTYWICLLMVLTYSKGDLNPESPCPSVFTYERTEQENDRWFGTVLLSTDESLVGVRLDIKLDRPTLILVSWLGEVTTEDNERFTILSLSQKLHPGPPLSSRFMVKFNFTQGTPQVRTIRLNGRQICPPDPNFSTDVQDNYESNFMRGQEITERATKRPDLDFEDNRGPLPTTEATRRTTSRYNSEEYEVNPPKRENNNFYQENAVTHSTTERHHDSEKDYPARPINHNNNCNENNGCNINDNRFSTTERYNNDRDDRPGSNSYNQQKTTHKPTYINEPEGSHNNDRFSTTERYNNDRDDRPGSNSYNQQKTTHKPTYINEPEGSHNNDRFSTTEKYNNVGVVRPVSNTYNHQKTTHKPSYTNENEGTHNNYQTTESHSKVGDDRPEYNTNNQHKTTRKPNKNENERNNGNEPYSTTESYNNVGNDRPGSNNNNQQKTTSNPNYNVNSNRRTTPKPISVNKGITPVHHNNNHESPKSNHESPELHLSTEYQINNGQSNKYPTSTLKQKNDTSNNKQTNSDSGRTTKLPAKDLSITKYHKTESDDLETASTKMECGRVQLPPTPLITNGQNTARGQWPWHIALYKIEGINLSYICGGSLISSTVVVTAAHCVTKSSSGRPVDADILVVYLGKYHLYQFSDDGGVQNKQVRDVHVYPRYNHTNFHNDIAVLTLTSPVEYTMYVRPVCVWDSDDTDLNAVEGKEGTVVGWGYDENDQVTEELKMALMPVVSQQTCIWSYPQFFSQFTSNKTFCAGFREETPETEDRGIDGQKSRSTVESGTSVCNGDSGGGMVFSKESLWYLRGLVSITVARQGLRVCDTSHYVVFTDVAKYLDWIRQYIT